MALTTYPLNCGKHQIRDLDADANGNFIALLSNNEVWTNTWKLALQQPFRYPFIRQLNEERFLIVEGRQSSGMNNNGHILDQSGRELLTFDAGDAVADVLVQAARIVISYFDEGIGNHKPSSDGLAVFDTQGQQLYGYNSSASGFILDCYCMTKQSDEVILAYPYTEFPLLELRLSDFQTIERVTPVDFRGAYALSGSHDNVIFYARHEDQNSFFWWNKQGKVQRFGRYNWLGLRGIGQGKFLRYDAQSFTIIDAMGLMRQEHQRKSET
ncbi:hypothetical protein [Hymenobacter cavernae]|uniref:WG repeat-containing protein n=1 Tax=Hymenobacter cavernae TaxID=2044852 RepID=A0ABQ1U0R9_9BACT|nr:hypothetical protein [Hymenobacter cavernae]GGF07190.1 hypothetical protein GCM10011383_17820 [Hymenobacter cavernae]